MINHNQLPKGDNMKIPEFFTVGQIFTSTTTGKEYMLHRYIDGNAGQWSLRSTADNGIWQGRIVELQTNENDKSVKSDEFPFIINGLRTGKLKL